MPVYSLRGPIYRGGTIELEAIELEAKATKRSLFLVARHRADSAPVGLVTLFFQEGKLIVTGAGGHAEHRFEINIGSGRATPLTDLAARLDPPDSMHDQPADVRASLNSQTLRDRSDLF